ncbi:hypothetical protein ACWCXH_35260 [Kitasatospora sp. NPDC001660]
MDDLTMREHARQLRRIADELDPASAHRGPLTENPAVVALAQDKRSEREQYNGYVLTALDLKRRTSRYLAEFPDRQKGDVMSLAMDQWLTDRGY